MRRVILLLVICLISAGALAQQEYVPRYIAFGGFSYLNSPKINLAERGFNAEFGVNMTRWLTVGADYSVFYGHSTIFPQELTTAIQLQLAGVVPPGVPVFLPFDSTTYTFAAGPQFDLRKLNKWVTLFARPGLGALHESATLKPTNPVTAALVAQLAPGGKKTDWEPFYGAGGGFEIASNHFGVQVSFDWVHVFLFQGFLNSPRNSLRMSIGPTFRFGENVKQ